MNENESSTPLGLLFIATFWIIIGAMILGSAGGYSSGHSVYFLIILGISLFCIVLGWGVLAMKKWAFTVALVISVFGLLYLLPFCWIWFGMIYGLLLGWNHPMDPYMMIQWFFTSMIPLLFVPMAVYLLKNKDRFLYNV